MYQIPLHAAFYAVCVGGVFGIAVLIFQFTKFRQKYIQLERAVNQKEFLLENLPKGRRRIGSGIRKNCGTFV